MRSESNSGRGFQQVRGPGPLTVYRKPKRVDAWPAFGSATFEMVTTPNVSFGLILAAQGVAVLLHQQEAAAPVVEPHPCTGTIEAARGADLLVHESTFGDEEAERAVETGHSTAREAATVARDAGVRRLLLTHFSARYSRDAIELEREARSVFAETLIGRDGTEVDVPFRDSLSP